MLLSGNPHLETLVPWSTGPGYPSWEKEGEITTRQGANCVSSGRPGSGARVSPGTADGAVKFVSAVTPSDDAKKKKKKVLSFTSCLYSNIFSQFQILSYFIEWKVLNRKGSRRIMLHFLMSQETLFMVTCQIVYEQTHFFRH